MGGFRTTEEESVEKKKADAPLEETPLSFVTLTLLCQVYYLSLLQQQLPSATNPLIKSVLGRFDTSYLSFFITKQYLS